MTHVSIRRAPSRYLWTFFSYAPHFYGGPLNLLALGPVWIEWWKEATP